MPNGFNCPTVSRNRRGLDGGSSFRFQVAARSGQVAEALADESAMQLNWRAHEEDVWFKPTGLQLLGCDLHLLAADRGLLELEECSPIAWWR